MRVFTVLLILIFVRHINGFSQLNPDTATVQKVLLNRSLKDSPNANISVPAQSDQSTLDRLLSANRLINLKQSPVLFINKRRYSQSKEYLFYLISSIILVFGFFKIFYGKYFHNIFRVFFNSSLRQSHLTGLLLQARLQSLVFNAFFTITGGLYIWLLLTHYYPLKDHYNKILFFCVLSIGIVYTIKFCVLKFIGWVTGMSAIINTYIFVVFLVNKIIGIALIPFILFLAFASPVFFQICVILSLISIGIFVLMRFFRSYSVVQQKLTISGLHFLLYIISLEILPLLVLYKLSLTFLLKL